LWGTVPWGDVYDCTVPGDIALTFDDGPEQYTNGMVDLLKTFNARATFFITGVNSAKGAIDTTPSWNAVIKKMAADNHQLASHTWSHPDLSLVTEARRRSEMIKLEMAMRNIVGYFPTYMRPPYSSCNAACSQTMRDLGYHVVYFDIDTDDYNHDSPTMIQVSKNIFSGIVNPSNPNVDSFLTIAHDTHQQTAQNLTQFMLQTLTTKGYRAVTVGECLGDPKANWYRSAPP
jgi:peptidoglycan/xylan/chitin deacetylase (PgdA/CDA1 family)